jgi:hypothetical protein
MKPKPEFFSFDKEKTLELRDAYDTAIADGAEKFIFHGHALACDYVKYLLEYLENKIK